MLPDFRDAWILHEDAQLIVVHKEAGISAQAVHADAQDDLVSRLARHLALREGRDAAHIYLGVHQRLDRDTSGCVVFTRDPAVNPAMAAQFEGRQVEKRYVAVAHGLAESARGRELRHQLVRGKDGRMQTTGPGDRRGRTAVTRIGPVQRRGERALVELDCHTGRTHQLRVQLAQIGAPIAGDRLYAGAPAMRLMLHAGRLAFAHPVTGQRLEILDPLPAEMQDYFERGPGFPSGVCFERALELAAQRRFELFRVARQGTHTTAFRFLHMEADGVPGLSLDVYGRHGVAGVYDEALLAEPDGWLDALFAWGFEGIYVKHHLRQKNAVTCSDLPALAPSLPARGVAAAGGLVVLEHGVPYTVWLDDGLRTGLFLDQRDNRHALGSKVRGKRVLNLFAYTCGFSLAAIAGGASEVVSVDISARALERGAEAVRGLGGADRHRTWRTDAFDALERLARREERFDAVVVDPPSYATVGSRRFQIKKHYAQLCAAAFRVLAPGGLLLACLNHQGVTQARLRSDVHRGADEAGVVLESLRDLPSQPDFPAVAGAEPLAKAVVAVRGA